MAFCRPIRRSGTNCHSRLFTSASKGVFRQNERTKGPPFVTMFLNKRGKGRVKSKGLRLFFPTRLRYLKHCRNNLSPNPILQMKRREFTQSVYKTTTPPNDSERVCINKSLL